MPTPLALDGFQSSEVKLIKRRVENPIDCVYHPRFDDRAIEEQLLGPLPDGGIRPRDTRSSSDDSGVDLLSIPKTQALTTDQEQHLFMRLNLARYRIVEILKNFATKRLSASAAKELLKWEKVSLKTRSDIVRANVPLVLAMAKRTRISGVDLSDLISEGNLALLRAVDKFDCDRGFKFSTYACRAILKSFSRVATRTSRYRGYFPTDFDPTMEKSDFLERQRDEAERDSVDELKSILGGNQARLSDVEEKVIRARFALEQSVSEDTARGRTLEQVGEMIGVTKERVRQIQNKALKKLKSAMETKTLAPR